MAKKSLLLVDADSKSLRMLEVSLRKSGFSVTTAIHAADARDKLKHAAPDLIITDTKLPGDENGFDFVADLKRQPETANIPIIFLSSENRLEQKVTGLELGVEDYLTKPIYIKEVLTRVRVLLDKREKQTLEKRERSSSFSGLLGDMGLVDLMQTVEIGRKTGRLFIETRQNTGLVSFREGKVCNARAGRLSGERAFYRMLVWNEGTFSMEFGAHDDADVIELSTQGLLMEGMRRVDEWGRLIEQLPPLEHVFEIDFNELVERLAEIPDEVNQLLRLFDGRRTLLQVVDETDFGDLEALEIASKLFFEGLIFDVTSREPEPPVSPHKVEAWLQEPSSTTAPAAEDDEHEHGLLVPNDTVPPTVASPPAPPGAEGILAPPRGHPLPSTRPTPSPDVLVTASLAPAGSLAPPSTMPTSSPDGLISALPAPAGSLAPPREDLGTMPPPAATTPAPRPLPSPALDEPEARSVLPRSAVNATAWSSTQKPSLDDDDGWEDVVAPDDDSTPNQIGPQLPPAGPLAPPPALVGTASPPLPAPPPVGMSAAANALADELGLSADEVAAVSGPPTIVEPADHDEDLAARIARQLQTDPSLPRLSAETLAEGPPTIVSSTMPVTASPPQEPTAPPVAADHAPSAPQPPTAPSSSPQASPPPPPQTATPSVAPARGTTEDDDGIHERRTQLDIDPLTVERFGIRPSVAAAVFVAGFLGVLAIVVATSDDGAASADAGVAAVAVDAGATVAHVDRDAGPSAAPVDARVAVAVVVDAGDAWRLPERAEKAERPEQAEKPAKPPEEAPNSYEGQLKLAEAFARKGDFGRSVRAYKAALALHRDGVAAHLGLGNAYYELDNLEAALFHLEKARALAPRDPQVYVLLGAAYQSASRKDDAIAAYERYLALAPDGKFARDVKGILRGLKG